MAAHQLAADQAREFSASDSGDVLFTIQMCPLLKLVALACLGDGRDDWKGEHFSTLQGVTARLWERNHC